MVVPLTLLSVHVPETLAQACDTDGVPIEFRRLRNDSLELKDVKTKEIVGRNIKDSALSLGRPTSIYTSYEAGLVRVAGISIDDYPDIGLNLTRIDRQEPNVWEVNFPRGLYEFRKKNDLEVEMFIRVEGGQAAHIDQGPVSTVALEVEPGKMHETWWGGTNSLRRLRGNLNFTFSNVTNLGVAGIHRARLNVCVNVRGNL
ncbi:MAG: hypothetical protein KJN90_11750 [Gammaproteobacteria bacterium]|nr:hypothetical protein [Gammaproteobacteria bacterium]